MVNRWLSKKQMIKLAVLIFVLIIFFSAGWSIGAENDLEPEEIDIEEVEDLEEILDLDTEDIDISELFSSDGAEEDNLMFSEDLHQIRDPFENFTAADREEGEVEDTEEEEENDTEEISYPDFAVSGYSILEDKIMITVYRGGEYIILSPGETIAGYRFVELQDREATFVKENEEFNLSIGSEQE